MMLCEELMRIHELGLVMVPLKHEMVLLNINKKSWPGQAYRQEWHVLYRSGLFCIPPCSWMCVDSDSV